MTGADDSLPDDIATLKAMLLAERAARTALQVEAQARALEIEKLKFAIAQKPRSDLIALAHKNIGVGYAKAHQPEEAISHLKIYLRLRPDAPDREMIEKLVEQVEQK